MAINARVVTVANTPTKLSTTTTSDRIAGRSISVSQAAALVRYGGSNVTWATGFTTDFAYDSLQDDDVFYGITQTGTAPVNVIEGGL